MALTSLTDRGSAIIADARGALSQRIGSILGEVEKNTSVAGGREVKIEGFNFTIRVRETTTNTASLTTHYVEDGSNISDHVIIDPTIVTIEAIVSEVTGRQTVAGNINKRIVPVLTDVAPLIPPAGQALLSNANAAISTVSDVVERVNSTLENGANLFDIFSGNKPSDSLQKQASSYLNILYTSGKPLTIQTKHQTLNNMIIISFSENAEQRGQQSFSLSLQQARIATNTFTTVIFPNATSNTKNKLSSKKNNGNVETVSTPPEKVRSTLAKLIG